MRRRRNTTLVAVATAAAIAIWWALWTDGDRPPTGRDNSMLAEIEQLGAGDTKPRNVLGEALRAMVPWVNVDTLMKRKRAAYDPALREILKRHGVCPDNLDALLDSAADEATRSTRPSLVTTVPAGTSTMGWALAAWHAYKEAVAKLARELDREAQQ